MDGHVEGKDIERKVRLFVGNNVDGWYDAVSVGEVVIESCRLERSEHVAAFVVDGFVDVEFKAGWRSSARERSSSGRVLFTIRIDAESGDILSVKHRAKQE